MGVTERICLPETLKAVVTMLERSIIAMHAAWDSGMLRASLPPGSSAFVYMYNHGCWLERAFTTEELTAEAIAAAAYARVGGTPAYGDFNYDLGMALAPVCVKHKQVILTTIRISAGVLLRASNAVNRIGAALEAWLADEDL